MKLIDQKINNISNTFTHYADAYKYLDIHYNSLPNYVQC